MMNLNSYKLEKIKNKDLLNLKNNKICLTSFFNVLNEIKKIKNKYESEYLLLSKCYSKEKSIEINEGELFSNSLISISKKNQINISLYSGFFVSFLELVKINKYLSLIFRDNKNKKKLEGFVIKVNKETELIFCWDKIVIKYTDMLKQVKIKSDSILFIDLNEEKEILYTIRCDINSNEIYKWITNESISNLKDCVLCEVFNEESKLSQSRYYNIQNQKILTTYINPKLENLKKKMILDNISELLYVKTNNDKIRNYFSEEFKQIGLINCKMNFLTTEQEKNILTMNLMI